MFNEASARCVRAWKDAGERRMSQVLASVMAPYVQPHWMSENPCVVAIPASKQAQRRRGFDHGQELAYAVARELGLNSCALLAPPHTNDQRKLDRQGRLNNLKKRFTVNSFSSVPESVLMVDDVHTTGATLFAAGDALHEAGVKHVYALTFARVW
jgi:predicted amidophosphoribosyltransferase